MHNSYDDVMDDICGNGVPGFGVCNTIVLRGMCAINESERNGKGLVLKPDPCSPRFYVNSTIATDSEPPRVTNVRP